MQRSRKLGFKNILIIFLVALLGGGIGTFGVINIYKTNNEQVVSAPPVTSNVVSYNTKKETNYTKAKTRKIKQKTRIYFNCISLKT